MWSLPIAGEYFLFLPLYFYYLQQLGQKSTHPRTYFHIMIAWFVSSVLINQENMFEQLRC